MHISTEGIVLTQRKIAGNRRLIVIFTKKYGKLTVGTTMNEKGKGKSALALRPFTYADYNIFKGRDYCNLDSAQVIRSFYAIGENWDKYVAASRLLKYLDSILEEGQASTKLFEMSIKFFESIANTKSIASCKTLLYAFIVKSLRVQGIAPELKCCANCGKKIENFEFNSQNKNPAFSVESGGILCESCEEIEKSRGESLIFKPSFDIVSVLYYFYDNPFDRFEKLVLKSQISDEINRILSAYIKHYLGVNVLEDEFV